MISDYIDDEHSHVSSKVTDKNKKRILLVDNNPVILSSLEIILKKSGYEIKTAKDGISALKILKYFIPDVIIVDLIMQNINGEQLSRIIRTMPRMRNVRVIILSAIAAEYKGDVSKLGADACIAKGPLDKMSKNIIQVLEKIDDNEQLNQSEEVIGISNTNSREIVQELLLVKAHLEIILSCISEGILEVTNEAKIVFANPAAMSIIGLAEEKILAVNFLDLFQVKDRKALKKRFSSQMKILREINGNVYHLTNGKKVNIDILPIDSNLNNTIIVLSDVTEKERLEAQIRHLNKIEAIGTLAGGIAHDFNNLLMGIQGYTSLMLLDTEKSHPHYEKLRGIEDQVKSGANLARQLLGFARKGKYDVKPTDLNELIDKTSIMFGRTKKEITIHKNFEKDLRVVEVDRGQMEQVLLNLYVNAWQAMPGGGDLYLETANVVLDEKFTRTQSYEVKPGSYVRISVTDTGVGMDEKTKERIFEPFFTTKEMGRGTGMGLASTYGIIKNHGGIITVYSEIGLGSTFKLYLPASDKEAPREESLPLKIVKGKGTVFIVDDEEVIVDVSREMLELLGYKVVVARTGLEAVELYKKQWKEIDVVILDMIMPQMSGGETFDAICAINPDVRVILSSGYAMSGKAKEIMDRGCKAFLQKPFNITELTQKISEVLSSSNG